VSDWGYVAIAYTVVWGSLAVYAVILARRVAQANRVARRLREAGQTKSQADGPDSAICDAPPAP
jgi:hypothetical protein